MFDRFTVEEIIVLVGVCPHLVSMRGGCQQSTMNGVVVGDLGNVRVSFYQSRKKKRKDACYCRTLVCPCLRVDAEDSKKKLVQRCAYLGASFPSRSVAMV